MDEIHHLIEILLSLKKQVLEPLKADSSFSEKAASRRFLEQTLFDPRYDGTTSSTLEKLIKASLEEPPIRSFIFSHLERGDPGISELQKMLRLTQLAWESK